MWCRAVVLCCVVAVALAAVAQGPLLPKPDKFKHLEGCYIPDLDAVIPFGKNAPDKKTCMLYRCNSDSITYETCGSVGAGPGLKVVQDLSKPYPGCCPKVQ